jgi:hypothetical protein
MSGYYHQYHSGCHDSDDTGLDGKVVEISGGEENSVGQNSQDDPDNNQGTDHGQHASIYLEL